MICHGCSGRGWVDSQHKGPSICPICNGTGMRKLKEGEKPPYDQDYIWKKLLETPDGQTVEGANKVDESLENYKGPKHTIIHLVFDRDITPRGSLLLDQIMSKGQGKQYTKDELRALGYCITSEGKVQIENGVPVGETYNRLKLWSYGRGELKVDANRKGNPLFIDQNLAAIEMIFHHDISVKKSMDDLPGYLESDPTASRMISFYIHHIK